MRQLKCVLDVFSALYATDPLAAAFAAASGTRFGCVVSPVVLDWKPVSLGSPGSL